MSWLEGNAVLLSFLSDQCYRRTMSYKQLTHEERYQIQALLRAGMNQTEISMILIRHNSTISREIIRNTGLRGYRPKQGQCLAKVRRYSETRPRISHIVWNEVRWLLLEDWSQEQISLWHKRTSLASLSIALVLTNTLLLSPNSYTKCDTPINKRDELWYL